MSNVKKALQNKVKKAKAKGKDNVTYGKLKKVYNKGLAAYRTGHRPGASPNQWAMARVNSVLTGGKAATVDKDIMKAFKGGFVARGCGVINPNRKKKTTVT